MDIDPLLPKAIWGFNGTERPGAVYLAAALAGYNQKGLPTFGIYGRDVQDSNDTTIPEDVQEKLTKFVKSGLAVAEMRGKSYLGLGGVSMGIVGSVVDQEFFQDYLGMRTMTVDMTEFARRIKREIYDKNEFKRALKWVKENCKEGEDINPVNNQSSRERKDWEWELVVKMTIIARDLMIGNPSLDDIGYGEEALGFNAIAAGFQGQRQWTDHYPNGDFLEAILNSSFDWNGVREPFIMATENDSLNGVAMLFGHLLTDTAQIFSDVRTYWSPEAVKRVTGKELTGKAANGIIHLINSGSTCLDGSGRQKINGKSAMKPYWDITSEEAGACLDATSWCPAALEYFRGGGFSSQFLTIGEMPVTMSRVNILKGIGPVLQIAEGYTINLSQDVNHTLDRRTNPTWPTTWFAPELTGNTPFDSVYNVMANWGANHGAISYGHIGDKLISLASMLRIPVCMHNVSINRIFRPSAWSAFGSADLESADYRACKNYGSLYGIK
jgi:L-fucose isomerase